jgi:hypothetical protein
MGIPDRGTDVVPWVAKVTDNCGRAHAPRRSASWSSLAQAPRIISLSLFRTPDGSTEILAM